LTTAFTLPNRPVTWPANSEKVEIRIDDFKISAQLTKPATTPAGTFVLIPGFTGAKEDFIAIAERLADASWATLAYDQPGQFESTGPNDETSYSLPRLAHALKGVANWVKEKLALTPHAVGHSFGGLVINQHLIEGNQFKSATLLCSGPGALPPKHQGVIPLVIPLLPQTPMAEIWQMKSAMDASNGVPQPNTETTEMFRKRWLGNNPHAMRAKAVTLTSDLDFLPSLTANREKTGNVHIVTGEDDDAWPVETQRDMAEAIGAEFHLIKQAGHHPALEQPDATTQTLIDISRRS
jgi:pimeloyl-ACP methyl ester carboxylesterase